ncbi:Triosephosphate isomerase, cytosolic, partial [Camellia lanceoleosa]
RIGSTSSHPHHFVQTMKLSSLCSKQPKCYIIIMIQNCWVKKGGAFTGEVSAEMLVKMGIPWVILGHFERRALLNESNEFVGDKVAYALSQGLKVIACIGETLEQRESGSTMDVVTAQTKAISGWLEHLTNWCQIKVSAGVGFKHRRLMRWLIAVARLLCLDVLRSPGFDSYL